MPRFNHACSSLPPLIWVVCLLQYEDDENDQDKADDGDNGGHVNGGPLFDGGNYSFPHSLPPYHHHPQCTQRYNHHLFQDPC